MHKILKELDSHFIVELPNGATIKIAKGGLSSHMKEKVMFMAEGGMVSDKGFIPDTSGPVPGEVVPINVLPKTPPEARFTGVTRATPEEQMQAAKFAPGTADIYKTAVDQPRPVKQAPIQPYMPEQAPGGAEEAPISPLDFPMEAASLAGAGAKGLVRGAMAGREAIYKAIPRLASEVGAIGKDISEKGVSVISSDFLPKNVKVPSQHIPSGEIDKEIQYNYRLNNLPDITYAVKNNKVVGHLGVDDNNSVKAVFVDKPERNKGIAEQLYTNYVNKNGILKSDDPNSMEQSAINLWEKLQKKYPNEITKTNSGYIWEKPKPVATKIKQQYTPRINPLGMYSKLEQTIAEKMGGSATPEQIKGMLRDVKPEEMQYSGLNDFLQGKDKVSKQEVLDFVKANELPVQEKIVGSDKELRNALIQKGYKGDLLESAINDARESGGYADKVPDSLREMAEKLKNTGGSKFSQYTFPGGENYREKLYTLPQQVKGNFEAVQKKNGDWLVKDKTTGEMVQAFSEEDFARQYAQKLNGQNIQQSYRSSHWDEPNVLAHTRLNDRIDDEGRKHLFVEEIQSDWHQAGRKEILNKQKEIDEKALEETGLSSTEEAYKLRPDLLEQKKKIASEYKYEKTPDAPMKKTWQEFVSKNLLNDAAKGGYDNISWTTGAQQAERYNLAKNINEIHWNTDTQRLVAYKKGSQDVILDKFVKKDDLPDYLGKEVSEKLLEQPKKHSFLPGDFYTLKDQELEVGGEGMKGFYDKMIPDYMAKIGKKYGVKPEKVSLSGTKKAGYYDISTDLYGDSAVVFVPEGTMDREVVKSFENIQDAEKFLKQVEEDKGEQVWTMKITPEMRKDILEKGLPLYAMGGVVAGGTLNSKEAGAKDMNYKMLENNKDHYIMKHPDGSSFKVAKKGLNPEIMKKIEGYADFVQRAEGQIPGVDMPEQNASYMPEQPKEPDFAQMAQQAPRTKEDDYARRIGQATGDIYRGLESTYGARMGMIPEEYTPEKVRSMAEEQVLGQAEREAVKAKNQAYLAKQDEERSRQDVMAYNERAAKVGMPLRPIPGEKQELPLEAQAKQVEQPQAPEPQMAAQKYVDPFALYEKGIRGESAAKAEYAQQEADTYKKLQEDMNNGNKMFNDKLAKLYEQGDALKKAAETKNVDPNRYWSNLGTANKIGASISMILGSLGGALSGTDNVALKIIDKTIDNDIEAQKKNIDQANNLYRTNLEAVKNEQEAYNITKAQMIGNAEQVLKQKLATATSKEAIAQGQMALAKMQLAKQELLQKSAVDTVVQAAQSNPKLLTPEIVEKLPADQRERAVPGYGIALSKPGAEKMRMEIVPQMESSVQMINDLMNLRHKYGREITNRDVVNEANTLRAFLRGQMRTFLVGPGAVTESEQKILDSVIADPTKILSTDSGTMAALQSLKTSIQKSFANQARANGLVAPQVQAQSQQPVRGADGKFYIKQGRYMVPVTK